MASNPPRVGAFSFLRDPLSIAWTFVIALLVGTLYYVFLMRSNTASGAQDFYPFWAAGWVPGPAAWINVANNMGLPGEALWALAVTLTVVSAVMTGVLVSGLFYYQRQQRMLGGGVAAVGGSLAVATTVGCIGCGVPVLPALGLFLPLIALPLGGVETLFINVGALAVGMVWFVRRTRWLRTSLAATGTT